MSSEILSIEVEPGSITQTTLPSGAVRVTGRKFIPKPPLVEACIDGRFQRRGYFSADAGRDERLSDKKGSMMRIVKNCEYLQAKNCRFCLHVGTVAFVFGVGWTGLRRRLEIFTPLHWFRYSVGRA